MEELLKEIRQIKTILNTNKEKDPNELLTAKRISEEFDIGIITVRNKLFKDPKLPVQIYTHPMKVTRGAFQKYINENRHDYLSDKEKVGSTNEK